MQKAIKTLLFLAIILPILTIANGYTSAYNAEDNQTYRQMTAEEVPQEQYTAVEKLYKLGLFQPVTTNEDGTPNFALNYYTTRIQAYIIIIRATGQEQRANETRVLTDFQDLKTNQHPITAYALDNNMIHGISRTRFNPDDIIRADHFLTAVLAILEYDCGKDFGWSSPWELTDELKITNGQFSDENNNITRGEMVEVIFNMLTASLKNQEITLIEKLINNGIFENLHELEKINSGKLITAIETQDKEKIEEAVMAIINGTDCDNQQCCCPICCDCGSIFFDRHHNYRQEPNFARQNDNQTSNPEDENNAPSDNEQNSNNSNSTNGNTDTGNNNAPDTGNNKNSNNNPPAPPDKNDSDNNGTPDNNPPEDNTSSCECDNPITGCNCDSDSTTSGYNCDTNNTCNCSNNSDNNNCTSENPCNDNDCETCNPTEDCGTDNPCNDPDCERCNTSDGCDGDSDCGNSDCDKCNLSNECDSNSGCNDQNCEICNPADNNNNCNTENGCENSACPDCNPDTNCDGTADCNDLDCSEHGNNNDICTDPNCNNPDCLEHGNNNSTCTDPICTNPDCPEHVGNSGGYCDNPLDCNDPNCQTCNPKTDCDSDNGCGDQSCESCIPSGECNTENPCENPNCESCIQTNGCNNEQGYNEPHCETCNPSDNCDSNNHCADPTCETCNPQNECDGTCGNPGCPVYEWLNTWTKSLLDVTDEGRDIQTTSTAEWRKTRDVYDLPLAASGEIIYTDALKTHTYMASPTRMVYEFDTAGLYHTLAFTAYNKSEFNARIQIIDYETGILLWSIILAPQSSIDVTDVNISQTNSIIFSARLLDVPVNIRYIEDAIYICDPRVDRGTKHDVTPGIDPVSFLTATDAGVATTAGNIGRWQKLINRDEMPTPRHGADIYTEALKPSSMFHRQFTSVIYTLERENYYKSLSFTVYNLAEFNISIFINDADTAETLWTATITPGASMEVTVDISNTARLEFRSNFPTAPVSAVRNMYNPLYICDPVVSIHEADLT